jgi:hypothetical protein
LELSDADVFTGEKRTEEGCREILTRSGLWMVLLIGTVTNVATDVSGNAGGALNSATSTMAQGSLITSTVKNIHLDSGTQMLLTVTGSATQQ